MYEILKLDGLDVLKAHVARGGVQDSRRFSGSIKDHDSYESGRGCGQVLLAAAWPCGGPGKMQWRLVSDYWLDPVPRSWEKERRGGQR